MDAPFESFHPSYVQIAPRSSRSPVTGKTTVTSTLESERTLIHQLMMLGLSIPFAFFTVPERMTPQYPVALNATSVR